MECTRCKQRGKDWSGDDPKCGFTTKHFIEDNWNCATLNQLRDEAEKQCSYNSDEYAALITVPDEGFILLQWYKRRGRTQGAYWLSFNGKVRKLSLRRAETYLNSSKNHSKAA